MKKEFIFLLLLFSAGIIESAAEETLLIRISYSDANEEARVKALGLKVLEEKPGEYIETRLGWEDVLKLNGQKFDLTYVIEIGVSSIDSAFHSFSEVRYELNHLQKMFPQILYVHSIGETTQNKLPILAAVLSDNPEKLQDRPTVLFTGAHHAREPLSTEICLHLINKLCQNFGQEGRITRWLQDYEIWIIPVVNPEGYSLIFSGNQQYKLWRKNLRDNNRNGHFDEKLDGVDLNRNYGFNWDLGGSPHYPSPFFRGTTPFSEIETRALKALVEKRQFAFIIDFHSFGEAVLYPWSNFDEPPDAKLITRLATGMARKIRNCENTGTYETIPLDAQMGQSSVWHYGKHGIISFIIESGDTYYPPSKKIDQICEQNYNAACFLLQRLRGPRISGHVFAKVSRTPVLAEICLIDSSGKRLQPFHTEPNFGRFDRVVLPGIYSMEVTASGFRMMTQTEIQIADSQIVECDIFLESTEAIKTKNE